jgi:peptidoglycan/xylan/chitin deacetylase (PgdA/CDA1 family)
VDQHTYAHLPLISEDLSEVKRQIEHTNALFEEVMGSAPMGLRAPGGYANALEGLDAVHEIVSGAGLAFVSSQYSTKDPSGKYDVVADKNAYMMLKHLQPRRYPNGLLEIPIMGYSDRAWFDRQRRDLKGWIKHLQDCVDFAYDMGGLLFAPALHPDTHSRHDPQMDALPALLDYCARKLEPVKFVTFREVAAAAGA